MKFKWITRPGQDRKGCKTTCYSTQAGHIYRGEVIVHPIEREYDGKKGQWIEANVYVMERLYTGKETGRGAKTPDGAWSLKVAQKWVEAHIREFARHLCLMGGRSTTPH